MRKNAAVFVSLALAAIAGCAAEVAPEKSQGSIEAIVADADALVAASEGPADSARRPSLQGTISDGSSASASFSRTSRYLAWSFSANAGDVIKLAAEGTTDPNLDTVLILYKATSSGNPSGSNLAFNDDYNGSLSSYLEYEAPTTRNYVAVVRRYDYGTSGSVTLSLEIDGGVQYCGSWNLPACPSGQFCSYEPEATCGFADAPGTCEPRPSFCTAIYQPVCGCDGNTYSNECAANSAGVSVASQGACEPPVTACGTRGGIDCTSSEYCDFPSDSMCGAADEGGTCTARPRFCTREYRPVCGCDGRTYSNACSAKASGTDVASDGACGATSDCRSTGCGTGQYCTYCWTGYACIPNGAIC